LKNSLKSIVSTPKSELPPEFKQTFDLINPHLYSVEERIRQQAKGFDSAIEGYVAYAINTGGKRLRPALALLSGGATGKISSSHVDLAVIMELIHVATLVHDDIMDGAETRRDQPTPNAKWGNSISVLLGDCLFAHALKLSTNFSNSDICRRIADAANEVCTGEIIQTQRRFDLNLTTMDYYKIIEMKTAALFSAACELGAFISESSPEIIGALKSYGAKLGTAYQIYDDCLDIAGDEATAGKTLGTDLQKGKLTLPVIVLLQTTEGAQRERVREIILESDKDGHDELAHLVISRGAMRSAAESARRLIKDAQRSISIVPRNRYLSGLDSIVSYLDGLLIPYSDLR